MTAEIRDVSIEDLVLIKKTNEANPQKDKFDLSDLYAYKNSKGDIKINPLYLTKKVLTIDGKIVCTILAKVNVEALLILDHGDWGDPQQKFLAIKTLQEEGKRDLWNKGIKWVHCYTTELVGNYKKRLVQLGWTMGKVILTPWAMSTKIEEKI